MKIIAMADLHYFGGDIRNAVFNTNRKLVRYALPFLDRLIEITNQDRSANLFVNLGDLIQDTQTKEGDLACLAFALGQLKKLRCPCYSVLGNHDLKMMDHIEEVAVLMEHEPTCAVDIQGYHLVFLTPEIRPELGTARGGCYKAQYLAEATVKWLKEDLEKNKLPCLVFTHYALAEDDSVDDECMFLKNRAAVKEILKKDQNLLAVFSGHIHKSAQYYEDGVSYYLIGSPTDSPNEDGIPEGCYCEIELNGRELTVTARQIKL